MYLFYFSIGEVLEENKTILLRLKKVVKCDQKMVNQNLISFRNGDFL